jgi:hypothetical protein
MLEHLTESFTIASSKFVLEFFLVFGFVIFVFDFDGWFSKGSFPENSGVSTSGRGSFDRISNILTGLPDWMFVSLPPEFRGILATLLVTLTLLTMILN